MRQWQGRRRSSGSNRKAKALGAVSFAFVDGGRGLSPDALRGMALGLLAVSQEGLEGRGNRPNAGYSPVRPYSDPWAKLTPDQTDDEESSWAYHWGRQLGGFLGTTFAEAYADGEGGRLAPLWDRYPGAIGIDEFSIGLFVAAGGEISMAAKALEWSQEAVELFTLGLFNPGDVGGLEDAIGEGLSAIGAGAVESLLGGL